MKIDKVKIDNFKRISSMEISLQSVNYLVGGNNSGKSSALQAIHMAVSCAKLSLERQEQVLPESDLRYSPTSEFSLLGHSGPYENRTGGSRGQVEFFGEANDGTLASYRIEIYKGRNYGNVGVNRSGTSAGFGQVIADPKSLFSIYVPGLSGIPHREEYKNYAAVFLKAAGGDANLVFRNILRLLHENETLQEVNTLLEDLIGPCKIKVNHDVANDLYVNVTFSQGSGKEVPIDLVGTGILQIVQILSYVALFKPAFLLVDEPDNHLHPSRQVLLSRSFSQISDKYGATVIVSTHSRHMVASAPESANIVWVRDGKVESDQCKDLAAVLMDLGALDQLDKEGAECIICTEDRGKAALELCVEKLHLSSRVKVISYNGISNATSAVAIKAMCELFEKEPKVIIHRDRDFLTEEELSQWGEEYRNRNMYIFSPPLCDVEAYYCMPEHLALVYCVSIDVTEKIVKNILVKYEEEFRKKFRSKRQEANKKFWQDGGGPGTNGLWPEKQPIELQFAYGKFLLSKLNDELKNQMGERRNLQLVPSSDLVDHLRKALKKVGIAS
ncbi:ATP-dependent nuclease [Beijerinckia mobilis]|uniref:ATP-dependent nuclease n=1 Tax=Beijerinckia mobilis TaxID=231434 RepID=UPI000A028CC6|nr:ATP-binding protein [Beijerinckia mobilis]